MICPNCGSYEIYWESWRRDVDVAYCVNCQYEWIVKEEGD